MHEMAVTESIYQIVMDYAKEHNAQKVTKITLRIGKMTGIEADCIRFYWETVSPGTVAEDSAIEVIEVPMTAKCPSCQADFEVKDGIPSCPFCQNMFCELTGGKELDVMSIEIS